MCAEPSVPSSNPARTPGPTRARTSFLYHAYLRLPFLTNSAQRYRFCSSGAAAVNLISVVRLLASPARLWS